MKYTNQIKWTMLLIFCFASGVLFAEDTEIEALESRVKKLEDLLCYITFLGLPALAITSIWGLYMYLKGIRKKVIEVIEKEAKQELEQKAEKFVEQKINNYPFIADFEKRQGIKQDKRILIVGNSNKDRRFVEFLHKKGFKCIESFHIDKYEQIDTNKHDVIFFNNQVPNLIEHEKMNQVVGHFKNEVRYFYFGSERWENASIDKNHLSFGFANNINTLEKQLTDLFMAI